MGVLDLLEAATACRVPAITCCGDHSSSTRTHLDAWAPRNSRVILDPLAFLPTSRALLVVEHTHPASLLHAPATLIPPIVLCLFPSQL